MSNKDKIKILDFNVGDTVEFVSNFDQKLPAQHPYFIPVIPKGEKGTVVSVTPLCVRVKVDDNMNLATLWDGDSEPDVCKNKIDCVKIIKKSGSIIRNFTIGDVVEFVKEYNSHMPIEWNYVSPIPKGAKGVVWETTESSIDVLVGGVDNPVAISSSKSDQDRSDCIRIINHGSLFRAVNDAADEYAIGDIVEFIKDYEPIKPKYDTKITFIVAGTLGIIKEIKSPVINVKIDTIRDLITISQPLNQYVRFFKKKVSW